MRKVPTGIQFKRPQDYAFIKPSEILVIIPLAWMLLLMLHAKPIQAMLP